MTLKRQKKRHLKDPLCRYPDFLRFISFFHFPLQKLLSCGIEGTINFIDKDDYSVSRTDLYLSTLHGQISIQRCDKDGDNRLRVCHSACRSYNAACGAFLDCSDQTLFSSEEEGEGQCTGYGETRPWWLRGIKSLY